MFNKRERWELIALVIYAIVIIVGLLAFGLRVMHWWPR